MAVPVDNVARYFLMLAASGEEDAGDNITHLKLQKLLYYAQGFHLALFGGMPLFNDRIEAWEHGPVVPSLWDVYRGYGSSPIPPAEGFDPSVALAAEDRQLLDDVWNTYGQFSAWRLREMTHREPPWREAYAWGRNSVITPASMLEYFSTQIA
jgi:uncharacterized phage-associated protein